jgi:hypothetical protein
MTTCTECGFPTDTPERPHAFIHQLMEALIEHRKILPELRKAEAELAALREALLDARPFIADHLPIKGRIERLLITESPARGVERDPLYVGDELDALADAINGTEPQPGGDVFTCPVCEYAHMRGPPENHEICPSCGTQFDYDDATKTHAQLRAEWIAGGRKWYSKATLPPTEQKQRFTSEKP